jgi:hypothetical protein
VLTVMQEKLAEAHALAIAASSVTVRVRERVSDATLLAELRRMDEDAEVIRTRCLAVERGLGGALADELLGHVNSTTERAADLLGAWFKAGTGPLAAWTFLAMGEAAEVATWRALDVLAAKAPGNGIAELAAWALPIQERHLQVVLDGALRLGAQCEADGPRWG